MRTKLQTPLLNFPFLCAHSFCYYILWTPLFLQISGTSVWEGTREFLLNSDDDYSRWFCFFMAIIFFFCSVPRGKKGSMLEIQKVSLQTSKKIISIQMITLQIQSVGVWSVKLPWCKFLLCNLPLWFFLIISIVKDWINKIK